MRSTRFGGSSTSSAAAPRELVDLTPTKGGGRIRLTSRLPEVLAILGLTLLIGLTLAATADGHHCRSKMCLGKEGHKLKSSYRGCSVLHPSRRPARLKCEIHRAAVHFGQSEAALRAVAWCESRYRWWINGHHEGAWQYLWSTWWSLPYGRRSPYSARWSTLATAYAWDIGRRGEWAC